MLQLIVRIKGQIAIKYKIFIFKNTTLSKFEKKPTFNWGKFKQVFKISCQADLHIFRYNRYNRISLSSSIFFSPLNNAKFWCIRYLIFAQKCMKFSELTTQVSKNWILLSLFFFFFFWKILNNKSIAASWQSFLNCHVSKTALTTQLW